MNERVIRYMKIAGIAAAILVVIVLAVIIKKEMGKEVSNEYFSDDPKEWVSDNIYSKEQDDIIVDIKRATMDYAQFDTNRLETFYMGKRMAFFYHGLYKGETFDMIYFEPSLANKVSGMDEDTQDRFYYDNAYIRISPVMRPGDGVIDSYILARMEEGEFVFYVYLDSDWRDQVGFTNILWTDDFRGEDINVIPFDFSETSMSEDGVYVNRVEGPQWFKERRNGGIYVGEMDLDILKVTKLSQINRTFIYMS